MKTSRTGIAAVIAALIAIATLVPAQGAQAVTYKAASAVRAVKSVDAWTSDAPRTPKIKLSWSKPAYTYGAATIGYAIQAKTKNGDWKTIVSNTMSTATVATVSAGLAVGVNNYFRVRAITKRDAKTMWGAYSTEVIRKPTAKPTNPILLGDSSIAPGTSGTYVAVWLPQNYSQRGGLNVTYTATASLNGNEVATCSVARLYSDEAPVNSCDLTGLSGQSVYQIALQVSNYRGVGSNTDVALPADSLFSLQWYLGASNGISATRAWTASKGSTSLVVAVLDSGITRHTDLDGQTVAGYDFVGNRVSAPEGTKGWYPSGDGDGWDSNPTDPGNPYDDPNNPDDDAEWHGTHVAGIIAAKQDTSGVIGVAPKVKIQPVRVVGPKVGNTCDLAYAIRWAAGVDYEPIPGCESFSGVPVNKTPARVINISLEAPLSCPDTLQSAVNAAQKRGVIIVTAAGNGDENGNPVSSAGVSPTSCIGPITVGASDFDGDAAPYSNFDVDISAPGGTYENPNGAPNLSQFGSFNGTILSTWNTGTSAQAAGTYLGISGTSMAAPVVAGIVALMLSVRPNANYDQVTDALMSSARPFESGTLCATSGNCGTGIANAAEALRYLIFDIG
ncbi:S8 family serine peptidase [Rhodoluna limnophila]|uniref:S8 family serine peptidase n=1 Tax=Rhodoluna limnophila TaxID=232537 RepID=UPI001105A603|nr:S8 family serine peptidase [Rhodoluna limnophila]